jgi:hypothetical protein
MRKLSSHQNNSQNTSTIIIPQTVDNILEKDFYPSFADWLIDEVGECSKAIRLGGINSAANGVPPANKN